MRYLYLFAILMCSFCSAQENVDSSTEGLHFTIEPGYTNVSVYDYTLKVTAEERTTDKKLLVIAFCQDNNMRFDIKEVTVDKDVAKVTGVFRAQVSEDNGLRKRIIVPVQIASVDAFSVSADEALIQGNQFYEKSL